MHISVRLILRRVSRTLLPRYIALSIKHAAMPFSSVCHCPLNPSLRIWLIRLSGHDPARAWFIDWTCCSYAAVPFTVLICCHRIFRSLVWRYPALKLYLDVVQNIGRKSVPKIKSYNSVDAFTNNNNMVFLFQFDNKQ